MEALEPSDPSTTDLGAQRLVAVAGHQQTDQESEGGFKKGGWAGGDPQAEGKQQIGRKGERNNSGKESKEGQSRINECSSPDIVTESSGPDGRNADASTSRQKRAGPLYKPQSTFL